MALHLSINPTQPMDSALVLAAEVIQAGGVVVYPTDTLYGIGANAWNPGAVARVQEIKRRSESKPILVIVGSIEAAYGVAAEVTDTARALMEKFWPGPLTLVLKASIHLPAPLTLGGGTIGVRIPASPVCLRLLALAGCPLTSTSANVTGQPPASDASGIERALGPGVDLYLDGGILPAGKPSTVLDVTGARPRMIREGAITVEQLKPLISSFEQ